jgi:hypothetical protein
MLSFLRLKWRRIVERIDETQIRIFLETIDRCVGCLDIEVREMGKIATSLACNSSRYLYRSFARCPRKCSINSVIKVPVPAAGSRISTFLSINALPKCFWQSQSALSIMKRTISFGA